MPAPSAVACVAIPGKDLAISNAGRCFEFTISGVDVGKVVMLAVEQVHPNNDAVEHRDDRHVRFLRSERQARIGSTRQIRRRHHPGWGPG